jgi:hypothetical protein
VTTSADVPVSERATRLVGRARELKDIERAISDVKAGHGRCLLLAGEPGIGKTRVADAAAGLAEAAGLAVHWGRCWEAGGAPAYFPWLGILAALGASVDDASLTRVLGDAAPVVAGLVPELGERLPRVTARPEPPGDEGRFRVWRGITALAREAAGRHPAGILLVLDDLHAADRSSLSLLLFLARELRTLRLLVIGTYRDVEARMDADASELILRIGREGTRLVLSRLGEADAADLVRSRAGGGGGAAEERILAVAQGNPLFLSEMTRLFSECGEASVVKGALPEGVRDVIGQRLARVSAETRSLLELSAVTGDEVNPALIAASSGHDEAHVLRCLSEAEQVGVLGERDFRGKRRFAHALFREVLYRGMRDDERAAWHARVTDALEAGLVAGGFTPYAELAHHALSAPAAYTKRGAEYAIEAAARAAELLAYDDAVHTLERALESLERRGAEPALRARVLVALGAARIRRGDGTAGKRDCREAASIASKLGDAELRAQAALVYGRVFTFGSVDPVLVGMLEDSLEALPPGDSPLRARLLGRLAGALQPTTKMNEPVEVAREAIATAQRLGDPRTLLEVLHDAISALMDMVDPVEQRAVNLEAERLALELGDRERLLRTHGRLAFAHLALGELALADARIDAFEALSNELAAPWLGFRAPLLRAVRAQMHGRFGEAEQHAGAALAMAKATSEPLARALYASNREARLRASERHDELLAWEGELRASRDKFRFQTMWQAAGAAQIHARREDEAQTLLYLGLLPKELPDNLFAMSMLVEAAALAGSREFAQQVYERVAVACDEYVVLGMSYFSWEGPRSRMLGLLLGRLERWEEAEAAFADAIERCIHVDARPFRARTEYEFARMLATRGRAEDRERARALLSAARAHAVELELPGLIGLIDARMSALGDASSSVAPAATRSDSVPPSTTQVVGVPPAAASLPFTLALEGEFFSVTFEGRTFRLKDSLGLRYLARLAAEPSREIHVLTLVGEVTPGAPEQAGDAGDAGEHLDARARETYAARLAELKAELDEAEGFGDLARAERAREELEWLHAELGRAVGLGGRARRSGAAAERARTAVQRRVRHAIARIGEHEPRLAELLERHVRTGTYCSFSTVPPGA